MKQRFFITGTDTEVGKTRVTVAMLEALNEAGLRSLGLKPLAAGAVEVGGRWVNEDALALQAAASLDLDYDLVNPVLLRAPMAPHLAAELEQKRLSVQSLAGYCRGTLMTQPYDVALIEGAGGWRVPLNRRETLADLPRALNCPVILVVGLRLGCLNHALLTAEAIERDGLALAGWVGNNIDPDMAAHEANLNTLKAMLPAPCLGVLPWLEAGLASPQGWLNHRRLTEYDYKL
ncbi:MAG: dethiobiotin synthase [Saccharospirillum sp.]|nr:dethiobiotin synthase [Saccharospirillum sp.]